MSLLFIVVCLFCSIVHFVLVLLILCDFVLLFVSIVVAFCVDPRLATSLWKLMGIQIKYILSCWIICQEKGYSECV